MKKFSFLMLLLTGALFVSRLQAQPVDQDGAWSAEGALKWASPTGPSYALSSTITGTVSSTIDMTAYAGALVGVTGPAGGPDVEVQWNLDSTASPAMPWFTGQTIKCNNVQPVFKQGNQMRFRVAANGSYPQGSQWLLKDTVAYIPFTSGATNLTPTGGGQSASMSGPYYASITFTATGAAANGVTIVAAVSGKTISVAAWGLSTDTAGRITLHHQGAAGVRSNGTTGNIFGGGLFAADGGELSAEGPIWKPGLAQNQPVCADFSAAMTNVEVVITYYLF